MNGPLLVVTGPTAAGKSAAVLALADAVPIEIVSADSVQVYRGLDIGSAKPSPAEQDAVPHHLIDVCDPRDRYSAARFVEAADHAIAAVRSRARLPVVVGGTGLYLRSLIRGLFNGPPADASVRASLEQEAEQGGADALHARLDAVDPPTAARLHANDVRRVIRALEVHALTGRRLSEWHEDHRLRERRYDATVFALDRDRDVLDARIALRCERMVARGLVAETEALIASGVSEDAPAFLTLGYRHVVAQRRGELDPAAFLERFTIDTRRFARRQRTWFRGQMQVAWRDAGAWERDPSELVDAARRVVDQTVA